MHQHQFQQARIAYSNIALIALTKLTKRQTPLVLSFGYRQMSNTSGPLSTPLPHFERNLARCTEPSQIYPQSGSLKDKYLVQLSGLSGATRLQLLQLFTATCGTEGMSYLQCESSRVP